ncbi:hypothetical protein GUA87_07080 [Sneathiella sp. P13V-1]|uniref:MotA/TolQ/ExbB proton channel family protein n=1 Tax=Sneathiella sp. P13V-1 TaxID=2697366 RepID=UPI00187BA753|nr:MotA/TolQ/ExbB proton channel family protein [Sneathiella sp. P13V-1]MBE7636604.1 hypothetical protein [Sneathiella sp. P13V-1]
MLPEIMDRFGVMGGPLLGCSLFAVMVLLERLVFILIIDGRGKKFLGQSGQLLDDLKNSSRRLRDEQVSLHIEKARKPFDRGINLLKLIATVSPIIGLLGTILGIISAFRKIASTTDPVTPNLIADGLWEALLTTAAGLVVALPCVVLAGLLTFWRNAVLDAVTAELNQRSLNLELQQEQAL